MGYSDGLGVEEEDRSGVMVVRPRDGAISEGSGEPQGKLGFEGACVWILSD